MRALAGARKSTAALPSTTAAPSSVSTNRTHSGAEKPGSATMPRSPNTVSTMAVAASAGLDSANCDSSQEPTIETRTTPPTKTSRALRPAARAVRAANWGRARTATTRTTAATTSPMTHSTTLLPCDSDPIRPMEGKMKSSTTKSHHAARSRRRRPTPSATRRAAYTRLGTIGTRTSETGSSTRLK